MYNNFLKFIYYLLTKKFIKKLKVFKCVWLLIT